MRPLLVAVLREHLPPPAPVDSTQRPQLLARAGRVAFQAGELAEAAAADEEAIAGLREQGDVGGLGAALGRLATVRWNQVGHDQIDRVLGLAIARGLVEAHGGTVAVANLNGGCRFTVRLPTRTGPGTGALRAGHPLSSDT
jgi:hypothetical protein